MPKIQEKRPDYACVEWTGGLKMGCRVPSVQGVEGVERKKAAKTVGAGAERKVGESWLCFWARVRQPDTTMSHEKYSNGLK